MILITFLNSMSQISFVLLISIGHPVFYKSEMLNDFLLFKQWMCFTEVESLYWFFISALSTVTKYTNAIANYSFMLTLDHGKQHITGQEVNFGYLEEIPLLITIQ